MTSQNEKALLVDDNSDLLDFTAELFRIMGYEVLVAYDGVKAIEILKQTPDIDVLFSDVVMPRMDGVELAQEAKKLIPGIKVLLASGYPGRVLNKVNPDAQAFDIINKPYRIADLLKALRRSG